jgi:hypothetical protein
MRIVTARKVANFCEVCSHTKQEMAVVSFPFYRWQEMKYRYGVTSRDMMFISGALETGHFVFGEGRQTDKHGGISLSLLSN